MKDIPIDQMSTERLRVEYYNLLALFQMEESMAVHHLSWMTTQMKWKEDQINQNTDNMPEGGYSEQLTGAINFLDRKEKSVEKYDAGFHSLADLNTDSLDSCFIPFEMQIRMRCIDVDLNFDNYFNHKQAELAVREKQIAITEERLGL
jgi:hypothetical protein